MQVKGANICPAAAWSAAGLFNEATLAKGADAIEIVRKQRELEDQRCLQIADQRDV